MRGSRPLTSQEATDIRGLFSGKMAVRNLAMFILGANTGFRISELLSLTLADILDDNGEFKTRVAVSRRNMKGKKTSRSVYFNVAAKNALKPWLAILKRRGIVHRTDYLFQSYSPNNNAIRNQAMFCLAANTGFRFSELLSLTLADILNNNGEFKSRVTVSRRNMEGKKTSSSVYFNETAKNALTFADILDDNGEFKSLVAVSRKNMKGKRTSRSVHFNATAKRALKPWMAILKRRGIVHRTDFLFQSYSQTNKAISRVQAWRVLTAAYAAGELTGKLGTHAMRKTFANNVYNYFLSLVAKGEAVDAFRSTSKALAHADIKSTDQYLSFLTEDVDEAVNALEI